GDFHFAGVGEFAGDDRAPRIGGLYYLTGLLVTQPENRQIIHAIWIRQVGGSDIYRQSHRVVAYVRSIVTRSAIPPNRGGIERIVQASDSRDRHRFGVENRLSASDRRSRVGVGQSGPGVKDIEDLGIEFGAARIVHAYEKCLRGKRDRTARRAI